MTPPVRIALVLVAALAAAAAADMSAPTRAQTAKPAPAPAVVIAGWERLIGTWVADNTAFKGETDRNDAYGIEWTWGLGRKSLKGRLYGIRDGKDIGTYWDFHEYWHPGEGRVIATQHGSDGTFGSGPHEIRPDGTSEMLQTFWDPEAGTTTRVGHRSKIEGDTHTTTSYNVDADGTWTERRMYVWHRVPGSQGSRVPGLQGPGILGAGLSVGSCQCVDGRAPLLPAVAIRAARASNSGSPWSTASSG